MKPILLSILLFAALWSRGQQVFTQQEFFDVIKAYHPVAKQASLQVDIARAEITAARGAFDPYLQSDIGKKEFKGIEYYNYRNHQLQVPTWFGLNLNAGMEQLSGERTNPEDTRGSSSYVGLSMPLANGLLMDSRRAALQQARIFQRSSLEEQRIMLNDLLLEAGKAYWNWWEQYETYRLFQSAYENAAQRFRLIKTTYEIGERPAIDTLEALAQLQSFRIQRAQVAQELQNARLELSVFLWQKEGEPYDLPTAVAPAAPDGLMLANADGLINGISNHPILRQYQFKIDALVVDRRLKFQYMLPYVTFKYNQLVNGHGLNDAFKQPLFENNYRYGLSFALPLRLSEGRGLYRQARLKIEATEWERINKQVQLETKVRQYRNDWDQLMQQVALQRTAVDQYAALQRAEELRFFNGESSLFLINSREIKTLEARQKLIELLSKQQKAAVGIRWAAGVLDN
jgi:outer membrane protein TolC